MLERPGRWWGAPWQSGLGQVCPGYGTYVSNSQERTWRTIKGLFKQGFRHQDVSQLVRETFQSLRSLRRGGQYKQACFQVDRPPPSLAFSAKRSKSEREDDDEKQSHRLTLDSMREWKEKQGRKHPKLVCHAYCRV